MLLFHPRFTADKSILPNCSNTFQRSPSLCSEMTVPTRTRLSCGSSATILLVPRPSSVCTINITAPQKFWSGERDSNPCDQSGTLTYSRLYDPRFLFGCFSGIRTPIDGSKDHRPAIGRQRINFEQRAGLGSSYGLELVS